MTLLQLRDLKKSYSSPEGGSQLVVDVPAFDLAARRQVAFWLPPLVFFALGLTGALTIGYRHMLPALPFLFVLAGNLAAWTAAQTGTRRTLALGAQALAVGWLAVGAARIYPHHGAYFNELAGPWTNWSNILVDSNLDWGQDLPALRAVMDERGIDRVDVITQSVHARRTWRHYKRALKGVAEVGIHSLPEPALPPDGWWRTKIGWAKVLKELIGMQQFVGDDDEGTFEGHAR